MGPRSRLDCFPPARCMVFGRSETDASFKYYQIVSIGTNTMLSLYAYNGSRHHNLFWDQVSHQIAWCTL